MHPLSKSQLVPLYIKVIFPLEHLPLINIYRLKPTYAEASAGRRRVRSGFAAKRLYRKAKYQHIILSFTEII
jgi:hypothetical protein